MFNNQIVDSFFQCRIHNLMSLRAAVVWIVTENTSPDEPIIGCKRQGSHHCQETSIKKSSYRTLRIHLS